MQFLPEPLRPLAAYAQFIVWEPVWDVSKQKYDKKPRCPVTGLDVNHLIPSAWMTFERANDIAARRNGWGVGFVITENDPFFCVDIDHALQSDGQWSAFSLEICQAFGGGAVEISYSGKGLHIFGVGQYPEKHRSRDDKLGLEFYTQGRFIALTGNGATGSALTDCTHGINYLLSKYLTPRVIGDALGWTDKPVAEWEGPESDAELIKKMLSSKSGATQVFGTKATVKELWTGDVAALARAYPSVSGDAYNRSSADAALCQHLAFWTGKNCARIQSLFEQSGLMRDKWRNRDDYRYDTVTSAASWCSDVYKGRKKALEPAEYEVNVEIPDGTIRDGFQFLGLPQQMEHFNHCVYVSDQHMVKLPNGRLVNSERFRARYGGYTFALDSLGDKTAKNAWEVFTESQGLKFPTSDSICFRPELGLSEIIEEDGLTKVNVYVPVKVPQVQGDPSPFLNHLAKLLPVERDREILLSYMAACVQFIGTKLRWAPFIQGIPGNGKSHISKIVARAIGRRYAHSPAAGDISDRFNDWLQNKLFIFIEDVYTSDRAEVIEILKPLVTEDWHELHPKGGAKYMADNRANFMLNSNHKDGLRKTLDDRRYAPFFTAQQYRADLLRDGMTAEYLGALSLWLKEQDGYAIMSHFLRNYPIRAEFDPRHMSEAPITSSTEHALELGLGGIEQEVAEAIGQGRPGFCGGWVSSVALDRLLESRRDNKKIPHSKRRDLMKGLGYIHHPALPDGRTTTLVAIDGATRPRLYVREGHLAAQLVNPAQVVEAYVKAQEINGKDSLAAEVFGARN